MTKENLDQLKQAQVEWLPERAYREEDQQALWFHDLLHNNPPSTPMGASVHHWPRGTKFAADWISFPFSRGFDYCLYNGRIYPSPIPIIDPAEHEARMPVFMERLGDLIANWPQRYQEMVDEWTGMLDYLKGIKKEVLPLDKLYSLLQDAVKISKRSWELHFVGMYPSHFAYMTFENICKENGIEERDMRIFLQGFETKMYEIDRGLWRLADLAGELGLRDAFMQSQEVEGLLSKLAESEFGQVWLDQFNDFIAKFGRRTTAAIFDPYYKTWIEDPYPALTTIKTYILKGGFNYEEHTKKIIEERDKFIESTLAKLEGEAREKFHKALIDAQNTYPFNEDHNFYVEQWTYSELRYVILECGRRLVRKGIIEDDHDVFFITIGELEQVLEELLTNRKIGALDCKLRIPKMVARRKQVWQELHDVKSPAFIGTIPDVEVNDPIFIKIWGYTDDVIKGRAKPQEDVANKVEGFPGAPGVIEGRARVIFGYEGFSEVMPDDILIAPFTTPAWTPLFSKIKGVCTDSGGMLAHAAICAREYNIPSVVGTITRGKKVTEVVKTGDWVRLDGTKGVLEVLRQD
ncbi:MAG: PEP-utilizing enzyme [Clostridia bacterium]|nr:PEP-utilizing enzyme [Clostridia bacterium]